MIKNEEYDSLLKAGLILDHYYILCNIKNGIKPLENKRIQGFINLLTKKGYIEDDKITEAGLLLVENCEIPVEAKGEIRTFATWTTDLHAKLQQKLKELTGATQMRAQIDKGKYYSWLPNAIDLGKVLQRVITAYKLKDYDKIEQCLLKYVEDCKAKNAWFPILQYYIMKDGTSRLVTDLESETDEAVTGEYKSPQKFI